VTVLVQTLVIGRGSKSFFEVKFDVKATPPDDDRSESGY